MNKELKETFLNELADHFQDIYVCTRIWSAWSYSTMELEDFYLLCDDEDFIQSVFNILKENKINQDVVISHIENFEAVYNFDIEENFQSNLFHEDWLNYVDIEEFCKFLNTYKLKSNFENF